MASLALRSAFRIKDIVNVKDPAFGARGDYPTTNDSVAIQAAIDAAAALGGCTVWNPPGSYKAAVILKSGAYLEGSGMAYTASGTSKPVNYYAPGAGTVIDTPVTAINSCGVRGISVNGLGAGTAVKGIRIRNGARVVIDDICCNNLAEEGVLIESPSIACTVKNTIALNCVLNRAPGAKRGAIDIDGTDHYLDSIESTTSSSIEGVASSVNLFVVAIMVRMTNGFVRDCIGEISDVGIEVTGSLNSFSNCRADLNYGHGYNITGSLNQFGQCRSVNNSQDTTNLYDNWIASGVGNIFLGPASSVSVAKVPRYGFNDQAPSSDANKNYWIHPLHSGAVGTKTYNHTNGFSSAWLFARGGAKILTQNSATPAADGYEYFRTNNNGATTITDFTGGVNGQFLYLFCLDANTTIQHNGGTIVTWNTGNVKLRNGGLYVFWKNGAWQLVSEDPTQIPNVSADNGDAIKTLQYRVNEPTQRWNTALTANRAVTLSTTGAKAGSAFHIVRQAGATGASTLDVGVGPLKSLAVSQWCDVEYDGAAWFLSRFGAL